MPQSTPTQHNNKKKYYFTAGDLQSTQKKNEEASLLPS
jgi:hypothetical protein